MDQRIQQYLKDQRLATLCCLNTEGLPHCFTCYYTFDKKNNRILFKSSGFTRHESFLKKHPQLAGTIHPDVVTPAQLLGAQITGYVHDTSDAMYLFEAATYYHLKNPRALIIPGVVWVMHLTSVELTDNLLGLEQRLVWRSDESQNVS